MGAFKELVSERGSRDELGLCRYFLETLIDKRLPWVATKIGLECAGNAFYNAQRKLGELTEGMVWSFVIVISTTLQANQYFEQSADILSYGATHWPAPPSEKLELRLKSAAAFQQANKFEDASVEIAVAAELSGQIGQQWRAYRLYWDAARALERAEHPSSERVISLLRKARSIANAEIEYEDAGNLVIDQKKWELRKYVGDLKASSGIFRLKPTTRILGWWVAFVTSGHYERPWRVLGCSCIMILFFGVLYCPNFGLVQLHGVGGNLANQLLDSIHFSAITFTTVGYGNIYPDNVAGKLLTSIEALLGIIFVGQFLFTLGRTAGPR
jgi:hypothetical protein